MPSLVLTGVSGLGTSTSPFLPSGMIGAWAALMVDTVRMKAVVIASDVLTTGSGLQALVTASDWPSFATAMQTTNPNNPARNTMNTWLTTSGYTPLTAAQVTWQDCAEYIAQQVNPAARVLLTSAH